MTTTDFKAQGNKAFAEGNFTQAVCLFSQAISSDPTNHVLFSNRSAAYASLKEYQKALDDAESTVKLNPTWAKGYSRKGAALQGLERFDEAVDAFKTGLDIDPSNALLKKGLEEAQDAAMASSNPLGSLGNLFGPDMWGKIAGNPKLAPLLAQPDFVAKLQDVQQNPKNMSQHMQDPRMMNVLMAMMGIDAKATTNPDEAAEAMGGFPSSSPETPTTPTSQTTTKPPSKQPTPAPEPVQEEDTLSPEDRAKRDARSASDSEKDLGNKSYKAKLFPEALTHYDKAWELDSTNVAVLTNKAAVLFEMEQFEDCVKVCDEAVEVGRSLFADYKLIARALGRAGSAYQKLGNLDLAIKYFEKSLSEHRTPDILTKLRDTEKAKKEADKEAYRDPALSDKAREEGNVFFKAQQYADAIKAYSEAVKRNDSDARNYTNRAACYVKLLALSEADKDCDSAIRLDPSFVKGYIRKAAVCVAKKDFVKGMDWLREAKERDTEGKSAAEIDGLLGRCYAGLNEVQSGANREEALKRAQNDPEVQRIMSDPVMQQILKQMQENPAAAQEHLKNPAIAAKINTLINAGVISVR